MLNKLRLQWLALSEEQQQNFGVLLAILMAILLGVIFTLLPHIRQIGWEHYRLTATVEVDGHAITTSQVYGYRCHNVSDRRAQADCQIRGEAMAVDLGRHGTAFFVMNQWNADHSMLAGADYMAVRLKLAASRGGQLTWNNLPALGRFRDANHSETAELIDPSDLEVFYGKGVVLTQFNVAQADGKETTGSIKKLLPWLDDLDGQSLGKGDAARLHAFDFKWPPN